MGLVSLYLICYLCPVTLICMTADVAYIQFCTENFHINSDKNVNIALCLVKFHDKNPFGHHRYDGISRNTHF